MKRAALALIVGVFIGTTAVAAGLGDAPVVFKNDNWSVRRVTDPMTDQPSCTGFYRNRYDIQVSRDAFYISMRGRGGISGYQLRFDDDPALPLKLATPMEKQISAVSIQRADIPRLLAAKRFRVSALTLLSTSVTEDIALDGLREAHEFIIGPDCR